ncbi:MAG: hypothetical protein ACJASG_001917 [Oleiphilaceae bacterium]|jgi:hypothetical protein
MYSLIYVSSATSRPSQAQLVDLLSQCHRNNTQNEVTGLLLYNGLGTFIQALEGEQRYVEAIFEKIKQDKRHRRIIKLSGKEITERDFPNWKMGFRNIDSLPEKTLKGFSTFMKPEADKTTQFMQDNQGMAMEMLKHFKSTAEELVF